jgi:DUF218 domain
MSLLRRAHAERRACRGVRETAGEANQPTRRPRPSTRQIRRAAVAVCAVVMVAFAAATARLFIWPPTAAPRHADAVVVFGGRSKRERIPTALRLMNRGLARTLVITAPPPRGDICADRKRFEVLCLVPKPFDTRGDARTVASLARRRRWRSLVLVTSTYHLTRAHMLLSRCYRGTVYVVGARPPASLDWAEQIAHEWGGLVYDWAFDRGC